MKHDLSNMEFSSEDKNKIIESVALFETLRKEYPHVRIIDLSLLYSVLPKEHIALVKRILAISPKQYGFKGEYHGITEVPLDLVIVRRQYVPKTKKTISTGTHFLPRAAYAAYHEMNRAMLRDIDRKVFIESGYRSCAYQLIIFLEYLISSGFDLRKTLKRVALPGYSEHGASKRQAVDFITIKEGKGKLPDFEKTKEYHWLIEYGNEFGFHLSYPKKNKLGIMFEPWHWHYERPK